MMEQVEVCNSWEEFDGDSKLLEQQLEKLKVQKGCQKSLEPKLVEESSLVSSQGNPAPKMRILKRNVPAEIPKPLVNGTTTTTTPSTNGSIENHNLVIQDDNFRTQYVPPEPRISILSRPKANSSNKSAANGSSNDSKSKNQGLKTLEQREQEYAEARKRIFGDAVENETETDSSDS